MNDLDDLLKTQHHIEDDNFTVQVMKKVPKRSTYRYRQAVIMVSTLVGSLLTFFIVTQSDRSLSFLREMYRGLVNYQGSGLAILIGIATVFTAIFLHQSQEI